MSAGRFIGAEGIRHVAQPPDTELCFAACVASATGNDLDPTHQALIEGRVSLPDGTTEAPMVEKTIYVGDQPVVIETVQTPLDEIEGPQDVIERIKRQLELSKPIALLALHPRNTGDFMHWTLFTGSWQADGATVALAHMNPLRTAIDREEPGYLEELVTRSFPMPGAYAYAIHGPKN